MTTALLCFIWLFRYNDYVTGFIQAHAAVPFFLYMPFSHVHTTQGNQPDSQYVIAHRAFVLNGAKNHDLI